MKPSRNKKRIVRHARVRAKIHGTASVPRVSVFRSNRHLFAQFIDDDQRKTLVSVGDFANTKQSSKTENKTQRAEHVASLVAERAKQAGINKIVFDRGGYRYHGRVKAFAEALRKAGLQF